MSISSTERYRIVERIGAGGVGVVYKVEDRVTGRKLAMKVMPRERGMANLRSEFLALARLRHDNIVSVSDYGLTETGDDFFTMEYVDGPPLLRAVPAAPSAEFYQLIVGVLRALAFIHGRGMVHADLKPSNILIAGAVLDDEPTRAARLADFGLAANLEDPDSSAGRGTVGYAAPEVFASRLDARSDLYSFGVIVYEMLTGTRPYQGRNVREVLARQRRAPPEDPRKLRPDLPAPLAQLVCALLDPAPGARPQTADEVLSSINFVAGTAFTTVDSLPLVDLSSVLVGREQELATLQKSWREATEGRGSAVLVRGEEGMGKSRLLAELKLSVQLEGGAVLDAKIAAPGQTLFAGLSEVLRYMLAAADTGPVEPGVWQRALAPGSSGDPAAVATDPAARFALAEAITGALLERASKAPLLLLIDDLHLADPAAVELVSYLVRSVRDAPLMVVLAVDQTAIEPAVEPAGEHASEDGKGPLLEALAFLADDAVVDLMPLDLAGVSRLAQNAFNYEIARRIRDELYQVSGGNPEHATRALELMVHNGMVGRERATWILKVESPAIPLPMDVKQASVQRLSRLPPRTRRLLRAASTFGMSFTRELLRELVTGEESDEPWLDPDAVIEPTLAEAVRARLLHADATSGTFHFAHKRLADLLYHELPEAERVALHTRAAAILEEWVESGRAVPAGYLAHHHLAVGDREKAVHWGSLAAQDHARGHDHHGAIAWYRRLSAIVEGPAAVAIHEHLGAHHSTLGQMDDACHSYRRAIDEVGDDLEKRVELMRKLGEVMSRCGDGDAALELLLDALGLARAHRKSRQEAHCHLCIGWALMYRARYVKAIEHTITGQLIGRSLDDKHLSAEFGRLRAAILTYQGDSKSALVHLESALDEARATGDEALIAGVLLMIGRAAVHSADYERAIDALERAIAAAERIGHIELAARCHNNLGIACYHQGEWQRARSSWERFRRLCERFDAKGELVNALNNLGILYRELGQFDQALAVLDDAARMAEAVAHQHMAAVIEGNRGEILFRLGDLFGARESFTRALAAFERIGAREDVIENRRRLCELDIAANQVEPGLDRAIDTAREARDVGARLEEGILHRVAASALRLMGDLDSTVWFVTRAREILSDVGARYELAKVDVVAGELAAAQGRPDEAARHFHAAIETFEALGARWDLGRARATKRAMAPPSTPLSSGAFSGRDDEGSRAQAGLELFFEFTKAVANVERERLLELALDRILELTGFERSFILLFDHDGRPRERLRRIRPGARGFARDEAEVSGTIVRRVTATGQPISVSDTDQEDDLREQDSVVALGLRQIMCAPMRAHGRMIGIIYIDSRRASFEEHVIDLRLLEAFAAQVALAVENSLLLAEERRKSELMAILAHEIRNPLAGILGYSEIGEADEAADMGLEVVDVFRHIRSDAERLRRVVDNVLELARHERGHVEWTMQPFDMAELIHAIVKSCQPACTVREVTMRASTAGLSRLAHGNADRVMQVLSNLVNNALKFTPPGGTITISARTERVKARDPEAPPILSSEIREWLPSEAHDQLSQEFVRVDVHDTGPGMTEELRARLFEKFSQGGGRCRSAGVGLGLYISREIILYHSGSIWVESAPDRGSTFSFRIPVAL